MSRTKKKLEEICTQFPAIDYEAIKLNDLAAYSIYLLQKNGIVLTFENVVIALFLMFPKKFSLSGFEEYPDAARVNRTLLQLRPKYRNYAVGSATKGFALSERGKQVAVKTEELLHKKITDIDWQRTSQAPQNVAPRTRYDREALGIKGSSTYAKYVSGNVEEITEPEMFDILGAVSYTPSHLLRRRIEELLQIAEDSRDEKLIGFLKALRTKFQEVFQRNS